MVYLKHKNQGADMKDKENKNNITTKILLFPLILIFYIYLFIAKPFITLANRSKYKKSFYFKDFRKPYKNKIFYSGAYAFYNSAKERNLKIEYVSRLPEKTDYFKYDGKLYIFPEEIGGEITYNEEKKRIEFRYGRGKKAKTYTAEEYLREISSDIPSSLRPQAKLFIERLLFDETNPYDHELPDCIVLTRKYEAAFSGEEKYIKSDAPKNILQLYEMIKNTPDICGNFALDGDSIQWVLDNATITITEDEETSLNQKSEWFETEIKENCDGDKAFYTTNFFMSNDIYDEVLKLGKKGNVTVYRKNSYNAIYSGSEENCPSKFRPDDKKLFFIKAVPDPFDNLETGKTPCEQKESI